MNTQTELMRTIIKDLAGGTIFSVDFIKKDGSHRTMSCRLGVKKHLKGGELPFDPVTKGLLPVYDLQKEGYRMINLNTIQELRVRGQVYRF
jgi:hypothetical protein